MDRALMSEESEVPEEPEAPAPVSLSSRTVAAHSQYGVARADHIPGVEHTVVNLATEVSRFLHDDRRRDRSRIVPGGAHLAGDDPLGLLKYGPMGR